MLPTSFDSSNQLLRDSFGLISLVSSERELVLCQEATDMTGAARSLRFRRCARGFGDLATPRERLRASFWTRIRSFKRSRRLYRKPSCRASCSTRTCRGVRCGSSSGNPSLCPFWRWARASRASRCTIAKKRRSGRRGRAGANCYKAHLYQAFKIIRQLQFAIGHIVI